MFFPCNVLAAASGDFGDMPFSQVLKIIAAYLSMFILFTYLAKPIAKLMGLNEDETLVFTRSVGYPNNGTWRVAYTFSGIRDWLFEQRKKDNE